MCSGAIIHSRLRQVYYAAPDPKAGAVNSLYTLLNDSRLNHQVTVHQGLLQDECSQMLKHFFREIRQRKKLAKRKRNRGQD